MSINKASLDQLRIDRPAEDAPRRPRWIVATMIAAAVVIGVALFGALRKPAAAEVQTVVAHARAGETRGAVLNASGYVTARRQATVSSKVTGKVIEVNVEEGMHVKAGQVLARIDDSIAAKSFNLAKAQEAASSSELAETRVRIQQAKLDYDRAAALAGQQIQSKAELDRARAELNALQARLAAQSEALAVASRNVSLRQQDVDDTIIRAPFDGVVVSKDAQPGEMISPISAGGGFTRTGVCTIVDMDSLEIDVDVSEAYINRIRPGQKVEATLDAYPDWKIPAHVITPVPTADRQKATVKVRIGLDAKDPRILPDMGVKVAFIDDTPAAAAHPSVELPKSALRHDGDQDIVFVVSGDKAERRAVKIASTDNDRITLASGVADGETVIVGGPAALKDGERVKVKTSSQ